MAYETGLKNRGPAPLDDRGSLAEYDPNDLDGQIDPEQMIGCHQNQYAALNVYAQPGFEYVWERFDRQAQVSVQMSGGHYVQAEDPEYAAMSQMYGQAGQLDSLVTFGDVALVRYSAEDRIAKRQKEENQATQYLRGAEADYAGKASALERSLSPGRPSRFRRYDHHTEVMAGDTPVEEWIPDKGIIQEG